MPRVNVGKLASPLVAALALVGCATAAGPGPHALAPRPSRTATANERAAYRETARADAARVDRALDLLPAVDEGSSTATLARSAALLEDAGSAFFVVGVGLSGLGIAGILATAVVTSGNESDQSRLAFLASGISVLAGVVVAVTGYGCHGVAASDERAARDAFPADLDAALGLTAAELAALAPTSSATAQATAEATPSAPASPAATTESPTPTPTTTAAEPTAALPIRVVARAGASRAVLAEFDTGPDDGIRKRFVDSARVEQAADVGGIILPKAPALFACAMRGLPKPGHIVRGTVHLTVRDARATKSTSKDNACFARALRHAGLLAGDADLELDIEVTTGPFVGARCRKALPSLETDAVAVLLSCGGLFVSPETVEITRGMGMEGDQALRLLAQGFREDACGEKAMRDLALCKRKRDDGATELADDVRAMEQRYVKALTSDDDVVRAALTLVVP